MMEVINDFVATVYYRVNVDEETGKSLNLDDKVTPMPDIGQYVSWKVSYHIKKFPKFMA